MEIRAFFGNLYVRVEEYRRLITFAIILLISSSLATWWRSQRLISLNSGAHSALVELEKLTHSEVGGESAPFKNDEEKWGAIDKIADKNARVFSSTKLASFFKAYRADALAMVGKMDLAISELTEAISGMPKSDISDLYRVKLGLMKLDSTDSVLVEEGREILKEISLLNSSVAQPVALYRLGEYFWINKNFSEAKNYWGQLVLIYGREVENQFGNIEPLAWAEKARLKLEMITPS